MGLHDPARSRGGHGRADLVDGVLAAAIVGEYVLRLALDSGGREGRWGPWFGMLLVVAAAASVPLARRHPLTGLLLAAAAAGGYFVGAYPPSLVLAVPLVALYHVGAATDRTRALATGVGVCFAIIVSSLILHGDPIFTIETFAKLGCALLPLAVGDAVRVRAALERASAERLAQAERARQDDARRIVEQERLRIARDLHDVLAHTMTTITVQSGVAGHLFDTDPEVARRALEVIRTGSADALDELRAMVGVLRGDEVASERLDPAPRLDQLGQLADHARASGVDLALVVDGARPSKLPDGIELAAYRIAQDALTNVIRHAGPVAARLHLTYGPARLRLVCTNDAPQHLRPRAEEGFGVGLVGMRERAAALGGRLTAGGTPSGGFEVAADLPYRVSA